MRCSSETGDVEVENSSVAIECGSGSEEGVCKREGSICSEDRMDDWTVTRYKLNSRNVEREQQICSACDGKE